VNFLSNYGVRSLSRYHKDHPYIFDAGTEQYHVVYEPGESGSGLFGGNSNWRGPIWFPMNFLFIEALERLQNFYGDTLKIEYPEGSGKEITMNDYADDLNSRLVKIFLPDKDGYRPCHGDDIKFAKDPHWKDLIYFYEYFHGETGKGLGASHQTGWTALVASCIYTLGKRREQKLTKN